MAKCVRRVTVSRRYCNSFLDCICDTVKKWYIYIDNNDNIDFRSEIEFMYRTELNVKGELNGTIYS